METRPIKALSDQQVADLKAGRGMGLALAAELNGYPGPAHVLELSDKLGLTVEQRARVQQLFESMKQEALPLAPASSSKRPNWNNNSQAARSHQKRSRLRPLQLQSHKASFAKAISSITWPPPRF